MAESKIEARREIASNRQSLTNHYSPIINESPNHDSPNRKSSMRPTGHLLLLCALLCVWEPVNLALSASRDVGELATDSIGRTVFLGFRLLVAGTGIGAGMALWHRQPHAVALAKAALTLSAISAVIRFGWFPGNTPPGMRLPTALVLIGYNAAWFAYLVTSPQTRKDT
jgi:hypothetical protein